MRNHFNSFVIFRIATFFILETVSCFELSSQERNTVIKSLAADNGLSSNIVLDLSEDQDGFLWIATGNGLDRFDGNNIKHYRNAPDDTTSISSNIVRSLLLDNKKRLWAGTSVGISKYQPIYDNFINFKYHPDSFPLSTSRISHLLQDNAGNIWIIQDIKTNISLFNPDNNRILYSIGRSATTTINIDLNEISSPFVDSKNRFWISDYKEIYCFAYNADSCFIAYYFTENQLDNSRKKTEQSIICESNAGNIYIANNGLYELNEFKENIFRYIDIFPAKTEQTDINFQINGLSNDQHGSLWVGSEKFGLISYNTNDRSTMFFNPDNSQLPSQIQSIESDIAGNIWVKTNTNELYVVNNQKNMKSNTGYVITRLKGITKYQQSYEYQKQVFITKNDVHWFNTNINGIHYFNLVKPMFSLFSHQPDNPESIHSNQVWAIYEDHKKRIWISADGLNMFDPKTKKMHYFSEEINPQLKYLDNTITTICEIFENNYFVASSGRVVWLEYKDNKLRKIKDFYHQPDNLNSPLSWGLNYIFRDSDHYVWIGTRNGLSRFDLPGNANPKGTFKHFVNDPANPYSLADNFVRYIFEDSKKRLWICTENNLSWLDKTTDKFTQVIPVFESDSIHVFSPKCIIENPQGRFWIATEGHGLIRYNESVNKFTQFDKNYGLPSNNLYSVFFDSENRVWSGSSNGLFRFTPETKRIELFSILDGLQGNEFNAGAFHWGNYSGKIYIAGNNGMNSFHPDSIAPHTLQPNVVFTSFQLFDEEVSALQKINNRVILNKSINHVNKIVLKHNKNFITISFAAIDFIAANQIKYFYKLEGIDKKWLKTDASDKKAKYTSLPPGNYLFTVHSTNRHGIKQNNQRSIEIIILPPWWLTWWAYFFYALIFISIISVSRSIVLKQANLKKALEIEKIEHQKNREIQEIKTEFFMNISHEFRTPLTLILGPLNKTLNLDISDQVRSNQLLIQRNANRLLRLINQLLDLRRLEKKQLKLLVSQGDIIGFCKNIYESFKYLAERNNIEYIFKKYEAESSSIDPKNFYFDDDKLEKILYNLLSNAFKYTPKNGKIEFQCKISDNLLLITVVDSGIGISGDKLPYIFDRFFRISTAYDKKQSGTGIGLALTKELVELHKGTIDVQSNSGKGTLFSIKIPISKDNYTDDEIDLINSQIDIEKYPHITNNPEPVKFYKNDKNKEFTILIVDDNPDIRSFIANDLAAKYNILEAENGEAALKQTIETIPDLIVSDVMMPIMNGIDFCKQVMNDERTSHIPIIMLTAKASEANQLEGLQTGIEHYLTKPFNVDILHLTINNILKSRKKLNHYFKNSPNPSIKKIVKNDLDEKFMEKAVKLVESNLNSQNLNTDFLVEHLNMSRTNLYRKLKSITGQSATEFIRTIRLNKALELLLSTENSISSIAYEVGFNDIKYFNRTFKERFKLTPSEYIVGNRK